MFFSLYLSMVLFLGVFLWMNNADGVVRYPCVYGVARSISGVPVNWQTGKNEKKRKETERKKTKRKQGEK